MANKLARSVLAALSKVQEPDLDQDLVTLNMVSNVEITGSKVTYRYAYHASLPARIEESKGSHSCN